MADVHVCEVEALLVSLQAPEIMYDNLKVIQYVKTQTS